MTPEERAALAATLEAATGGTWEAGGLPDGRWCVYATTGPGHLDLVATTGRDGQDQRNAAALAAMGNASRRLLDMLARTEIQAGSAARERDEALTAFQAAAAERDRAEGRAGVARYERDVAMSELADAHELLDTALRGHPDTTLGGQSAFGANPPSVPDRIRHLAERLDGRTRAPGEAT